MKIHAEGESDLSSMEFLTKFHYYLTMVMMKIMFMRSFNEASCTLACSSDNLSFLVCLQLTRYLSSWSVCI